MLGSSKQFPHLSKAPIVEALIDFRIRSGEPLPPERLADLSTVIGDRYPTRKETRKLEASLVFGPDKDPEHKVSGFLMGYRYETADGHYVLQASPTGFTLSRLNSYTKWNDLLSEAKSLWAEYIKLFDRAVVIRCAVRYINRVGLPGPRIDFDHYFTAAPKIPESLPQVLVSFLSRVVIPIADRNAFAIVTQSFNPEDAKENVAPVVLDIDVFREGSFDIESEENWRVIGELRDIKNEIFFSWITPSTIELLR